MLLHMKKHGLNLPPPKVTPVLDPLFRPAVLANRRFQNVVARTHDAPPISLALEQADG